MSFYDLVDKASTYTSIPFAIVGFGVTIWQSWRAASAAEEAKLAAESMRDRISKSSLIMLIPQLVRIEDEIDRALNGNDVGLVVSWLNTWRWQASQARGFLQAAKADDPKVMKALQASITACGEAKNTLVAGTSNLVQDSAAARKAISKAVGELGSLAANYGMQGE
ncbi:MULTISPECIES: hypothetical protein [unclassified Streptomyces]|uniref:hypothetical protein n=1 Tax=unclassified Streptomyces TaxID=2593676 RepID=UPI001FAD9C29|nr:hypothetical protein [Streptomyces sp. PBSH9]